MLGLVNNRKRLIGEALAVIGALIVIAAAYRPSLSVGWVFDDLNHIVNNPAVHPQKLGLKPLWTAATQSPIKNRPLANLSFALDYLRAKNNPRPFHQTNLVIHLLASIAAWRFLLALLTHPRIKKRVPWPRLAAAAGALAFALNPVQTQSVTYTVQRMNLLAGLFSLLAMLFYFRVRFSKEGGRYARLWWPAFFGSLILGLAGKENTITVIPIMLALDLCLYKKEFVKWVRARRYPLGVALVVGIAVSAVFIMGGGFLEGYKDRVFTPVERLLTQPRVMLWYVSLYIFPIGQRLSLDHFVSTSTGLFSPPQTFLAIAVILGSVVLAIAKARRAPLLCFGWLWFVFGLSLESSFLPIEMVFEHRLYFPSLGLVMIAIDLCSRARLDWRAAPAMAAVLLLFFANTYLRNLVWTDDAGLWKDAVKKAPQKTRPWTNLCAEELVKQNYKGAERRCRVARDLDPVNVDARYNHGLALYGTGRYQEAEQAFLQTVEQRPEWDEAYYQMGRARALLGRYAEAEAAYLQAIKIDSRDPVYFYQLGLVQSILGKRDESRKSLDTAKKLAKPRDYELKKDIEIALKMLGPEEK